VAVAVSGAADLKLNSQEASPPMQRNPDRPVPPQGGPGVFLAGLGPVGDVLTDEQRASFRQGMEAQREKTRGIETKLRAARRQLLEAGLDGKFDEAAVREQAMAVAALEAETAVMRAKALSQIKPPLSTEQIEKVKSTLAGGPGQFGARPGGIRTPDAAREHHLTSTNRDENDLPPKQ
jgi:Spy/CpxP family protein refolding chaperone